MENFLNQTTALAAADAIGLGSVAAINSEKLKFWTDNEDGLEISSLRFRSEKDESKWVAEEVKEIIDNNKEAEVAIFYRTNSNRFIAQNCYKKTTFFNFLKIGILF